MPAVVVVGAAARVRDLADPRGWRLGGEAVHGALLLARLGLRVGAVLGVDATTAAAAELELLREAGAELHVVELAAGPVLAPDGHGAERASGAGRRRPAGPRRCDEAGSPVPVTALPSAWRAAPAWHLAPAADELAGGWAAIPPGAIVAFAWQGALRNGVDGNPLRPGPPPSRAIARRANLVGLPLDEIAGDDDLRARLGQLRAGALCVLTAAAGSGIAITVRPGAPRMRHWRLPGAPGSAATRTANPDDGIFLAALLAARVAPAVAGHQPHLPAALAFAAAAVGARRGPALADLPTLADIGAMLRSRTAPGLPDSSSGEDRGRGGAHDAGTTENGPRGDGPPRYDGGAPGRPGGS